MKKNWVLSQESFDSLLDWLSPNRDEAGQKYEVIRQRLIKIFSARGCFDSEDVADETINRVSSKVLDLKERYSGDPALFFYAVGNHVHREHLRKKTLPTQTIFESNPENEERRFECLEVCLESLSLENRELVVQYYQDEKTAKINRRRLLAERLGIAPNALRIRACRIRASLLQCVEKCLGRNDR